MGQIYQPGGAGYFVPAMQQRAYYAPPQMQVRATPRWTSVRTPGRFIWLQIVIFILLCQTQMH